VNLNHWLKKTPQPVTVLADDKRITVPKNARAYRDLTATIKSLEPSKLTCLDANDNVIRSVTLESEADSGDERPPASAEMSDLQLFAKLLAEGYEHGRKANQPIIDSAMAFVERQGQRLAKAEGEIERLRAHIHKLNMQLGDMARAPIESTSDDSIMGSLVAGVLQGAASGAVPGASPVTPITKPGVKK